MEYLVSCAETNMMSYDVVVNDDLSANDLLCAALHVTQTLIFLFFFYSRSVQGGNLQGSTLKMGSSR